MEDHNIAVVRRVIDHIWNRGDLDVADHLFDAVYVNHGGLIPDLVHGPEAIKISVALLRTAFPRLHVSIEGLSATEDTVQLHWAAMSRLNPLGVRLEEHEQGQTLTGTTLSALTGGKIVESWTDWDHASALQRLQTVPADVQA